MAFRDFKCDLSYFSMYWLIYWENFLGYLWNPQTLSLFWARKKVPYQKVGQSLTRKWLVQLFLGLEKRVWMEVLVQVLTMLPNLLIHPYFANSALIVLLIEAAILRLTQDNCLIVTNSLMLHYYGWAQWVNLIEAPSLMLQCPGCLIQDHSLRFLV